MGILRLSLIIFISIVLLPVLSQAQNFRGGGPGSGFGKTGFGARGFTAGSSGYSLRGGFNRSSFSTNRAAGLRNGGLGSSLVKQPGFSNTNRTTFGRGSSLTRSTTLSNTLTNQKQNLINSGVMPRKSYNGLSSGSTYRTSGKDNLDYNKIGMGGGDGNQLISNVGSTFERNEVTTGFINSKGPVFKSGSSLNSTTAPIRTRNFTNTSSSSITPITVEEIGTAPGVVTDSSTRTEIAHWVDKKSGVRHFSNNISSYRDGRETITFVGGKKVVSKIGRLKSGDSLVDGSEGFGDAITFTKTATKPAIKQFGKETGSNNGLRYTASEPAKKYHHKPHHKDFDHHRHRHHHDTINFFFFFNPFFTFPTSTFFFGFNPFVFKALVLSPFAFRPFFFPSAFFAFHPIVPSPFLFNTFVCPNLFFPSFCNPFVFGSPFFFNQLSSFF